MQSGVPITVRRVCAAAILAMCTWAFVPRVSAQTPVSPIDHATSLRAPTGHAQVAKSRLPALECTLCEPTARLPAADEAVRTVETPTTMAVSPSAVSFARPTPPMPPRAYTRRHGIGRTWRFRQGRRVEADLTPSPAHCAPQVAYRF